VLLGVSKDGGILDQQVFLNKIRHREEGEMEELCLLAICVFSSLTACDRFHLISGREWNSGWARSVRVMVNGWVACGLFLHILLHLHLIPHHTSAEFSYFTVAINES
jgi:hypothetical protein